MKERCSPAERRRREIVPPADRTLLHEKVLTQSSNDLPPMLSPPSSRLPKPSSVANIWPALHRSSQSQNPSPLPHRPPPPLEMMAFRQQSRSSTPAKSLRNFLQSFAPDRWGPQAQAGEKRARKNKRPSLTQLVPIPQMVRRRTASAMSEMPTGERELGASFL